MGIENGVGFMGRNKYGVRVKSGFGPGWVGTRSVNGAGAGFELAGGDGVMVGMRLCI